MDYLTTKQVNGMAVCEQGAQENKRDRLSGKDGQRGKPA